MPRLSLLLLSVMGSAMGSPDDHELIVEAERQVGQPLRFHCKALSLPNGCTLVAKRDRPLLVHSFVFHRCAKKESYRVLFGLGI